MSISKLINKFNIYICLFVLIAQTFTSYGQAPLITYPTPAQNIVRAYGNSLLTVRLVFNGICTGPTSVKIAFPASVNYVASTISKIGGTAGVSITESSIADLRNPVFTISGISAVGDELIFTVARRATCGTLATAKDSIYFFSSGGCSNGSEVSGTDNTYNLYAPALAITPAPAVTGAVLGTTSTRITTIVNGGNGATDTLRFYIVYPNAGIVNTSGTNAITANTLSFTPTTISGDTLFYKIFGATIFGGNSELTNGETVTIAEPIRIAKCGVSTTYGAGWGRNSSSVCEWATGTSAVSMATGVPAFTGVSGVRGTYVDKCTPYDYTLTMTNGGSGNPIAAAMYDIKIDQGQSGGAVGPIYSYDTTLFTLSDLRIGSSSIPSSGISWLGGVLQVDLNNLFTTDPDGIGGLSDVDGDGFFDDLLGGASVALVTKLTVKPTLPCGRDKITWSSTGVELRYRTMCNPTIIRSDKRASGLNYYYESAFDGIAYIPANVFGGKPFRFQAKEAHYINSSSFDNGNTRYRWKIALAPGFSVSGTGNPKYGTTSVSYTTVSGGASGVDTVVYVSNTTSLDSFSLDLVYTCGTGGGKGVYYALEKIDNIVTGCERQGLLFCDVASTTAFCPNPCPAGPSNYIPEVRRADGSLGWTDYTLATRQVSSAISAYDLSKALYLDTVNIICTALQNNPATNLHIELTLPKNTSGVNKLTPVRVVSQYYRGGSLISTSTVTSASGVLSTATEQSIDWTLSLPGGSLLAGDSIYSVASYVVATNDLPRNDIQSGSRNIYFNINSLGGRDYCFDPVPEMYLVGTSLENAHNGYGTEGCNPNSLGGSTNYLARRFNTSGVLFQNEYRPVMYVDSIVATIPTGYDFVSSAYQPQTGGASLSLTPTSIVGNVYKFVNPGTWVPLGLTVTNAYGGYVPFTVVPNCATVNNELINFKVYIRDYYYAYAGLPTPPGLAREILGGPGKTIGINYVTANKPDITLSNQTGVVQGVLPSQSWTVRMSSVGLTTAPYTWLAIPTKPGITVTSITDVATSTILTPTVYPGGTWYKLSTAGIASGTFKDYKIDFTYTACTMDSLKVMAGWNCSSFPTSPTAYTCGADSLFLKVDPQPSQIQLSIARQPGAGSAINLCLQDSVLLVVNSAQAANLISPTVNFYPPTGVTLVTPVQIEYPLGSGLYETATLTPLVGGGYQINLSSHSGIGTNGMLGTALSNPSFSPLGGDRQAKIKITFTTDCNFSSGTSFSFNAFGNRPCGSTAIGFGIAATTSSLNIIGATAPGSAGVTIDFGGVSTLNCASATIALTLITIPTGASTVAGDTMIYTLPPGLGYAGGITSGFSVDTSGTGGSTKVKIAMPAGVSPATPINYGFNVKPQGGGCGSVNVVGTYKRLIASLVCGVGPGSFPCSNSSVIISSATSPPITLNKPNLNISNVTVLDTNKWVMGWAWINRVKVFYSNNGLDAYVGNVDSVEFFCGTNTTPFAVRPLTKSLAIGASDSDYYEIIIPNTACSVGSFVTTKIQTRTSAGTFQCLCTPASYNVFGVALPLNFLSTNATSKDCEVNVDWTYNITGSDKLQSFEIERSNDGSKFLTITQLSANTNRYNDLTPNSGKWYYRIKAIFTDGKSLYSNTLQTTTMQCASNSISVYPNPATEQLQIVLQGSTLNNTYELIDALGRVILTGNLNANSINRLFVGDIGEGVYMLKVINNDSVHTQQVQIIR